MIQEGGCVICELAIACKCRTDFLLGLTVAGSCLSRVSPSLLHALLTVTVAAISSGLYSSMRISKFIALPFFMYSALFAGGALQPAGAEREH